MLFHDHCLRLPFQNSKLWIRGVILSDFSFAILSGSLHGLKKQMLEEDTNLYYDTFNQFFKTLLIPLDALTFNMLINVNLNENDDIWHWQSGNSDTSVPRLLFQVAKICNGIFPPQTCPCNKYPPKPHFYIVKLENAGVYLFFLFLLQNIDCGYSLEPPRRGGSNVYPQSMF